MRPRMFLPSKSFSTLYLFPPLSCSLSPRASVGCRGVGRGRWCWFYIIWGCKFCTHTVQILHLASASLALDRGKFCRLGCKIGCPPPHAETCTCATFKTGCKFCTRSFVGVYLRILLGPRLLCPRGFLRRLGVILDRQFGFRGGHRQVSSA